MMPMSLKDYFSILRPINCLMASFATYIGYAIAVGKFAFNDLAAYAMVSVFLICGAGQAINDYFDREIDKKLNPRKPIPAKKIGANSVLIYSIFLFLTGIFISYQINLISFSIAVLASAALFIYSGFMKKLKYFGNFIVAIGTGATFLYGSAALPDFSVSPYLALIAILANYSRELIKDIEDIKGDSGKKTTLPILIGKEKTKLLVYTAYSLAIGISYYVFFGKIFGNLFYLLLITLANILLINSAFLTSKNKFSKAQKFSKRGMIAALFAFVLGLIHVIKT